MTILNTYYSLSVKIRFCYTEFEIKMKEKEMSTPQNYYEHALQSSLFLKDWYQNKKPPEIAVVLGSGLSNAIPNLSTMNSVSYEEIPHFKSARVAGHAGSLCVGDVSVTLKNGEEKSRTVAFLRGRNHAYEGYNAAEVVHNLRSLILWGVKGIVLTNASGCLNLDWKLGRMMILSDHINATGTSPLIGNYGAEFGARFVDMTECYDKQWQAQFQQTAAQEGQEIYSGVYYGTLGCQYETPAEIRMMSMLGAQAVGMSTVLESIAARQMGARVAALSCLTNYASGLTKNLLAHTDVMEMGARFAADMANVVLKTVVSLEVCHP